MGLLSEQEKTKVYHCTWWPLCGERIHSYGSCILSLLGRSCTAGSEKKRSISINITLHFLLTNVYDVLTGETHYGLSDKVLQHFCVDLFDDLPCAKMLMDLPRCYQDIYLIILQNTVTKHVERHLIYITWYQRYSFRRLLRRLPLLSSCLTSHIGPVTIWCRRIMQSLPMNAAWVNNIKGQEKNSREKQESENNNSHLVYKRKRATKAASKKNLS